MPAGGASSGGELHILHGCAPIQAQDSRQQQETGACVAMTGKEWSEIMDP